MRAKKGFMAKLMHKLRLLSWKDRVILRRIDGSVDIDACKVFEIEGEEVLVTGKHGSILTDLSKYILNTEGGKIRVLCELPMSEGIGTSICPAYPSICDSPKEEEESKEPVKEKEDPSLVIQGSRLVPVGSENILLEKIKNFYLGIAERYKKRLQPVQKNWEGMGYVVLPPEGTEGSKNLVLDVDSNVELYRMGLRRIEKKYEDGDEDRKKMVINLLKIMFFLLLGWAALKYLPGLQSATGFIPNMD